MINEILKPQSKIKQELLEFHHFRLPISLELEEGIDEAMMAWDGFLNQTINHKILLDNGGAYSHINSSVSNNKEVFEYRNEYEYPKVLNPSRADSLFLEKANSLFHNEGLLCLNQRIGTYFTDLTMKNFSKASNKDGWILKFIHYPPQFGPLHQTGVCQGNYMIVLRQSSPMHYENSTKDWREIKYAEDQVPVLPGKKIQRINMGNIKVPRYMINETPETKKFGRKCLVLINVF